MKAETLMLIALLVLILLFVFKKKPALSLPQLPSAGEFKYHRTWLDRLGW